MPRPPPVTMAACSARLMGRPMDGRVMVNVSSHHFGGFTRLGWLSYPVPVHVAFLAPFEVAIGDAPLSQNATPASPWPGGHAEREILGIVAAIPRHSFTGRLRSRSADHHDRRSRPVCPWPAVSVPDRLVSRPPPGR